MDALLLFTDSGPGDVDTDTTGNLRFGFRLLCPQLPLPRRTGETKSSKPGHCPLRWLRSDLPDRPFFPGDYKNRSSAFQHMQPFSLDIDTICFYNVAPYVCGN